MSSSGIYVHLGPVPVHFSSVQRVQWKVESRRVESGGWRVESGSGKWKVGALL